MFDECDCFYRHFRPVLDLVAPTAKFGITGANSPVVCNFIPGRGRFMERVLSLS